MERIFGFREGSKSTPQAVHCLAQLRFATVGDNIVAAIQVIQCLGTVLCCCCQLCKLAPIGCLSVIEGTKILAVFLKQLSSCFTFLLIISQCYNKQECNRILQHI